MTRTKALATLIVISLGLGVAACAAVIGADEPVLAPLTVGEGGTDAGALGDGYVPLKLEPDAATCPPGTKLCAGGCVDVNDPTYGCDAVKCEAPCSIKHGEAKCKDGRCAILKCDVAAGFADCNTLAQDGCETSLLDPATCTRCDKQCDLTQVCDLKNGGCSATCGSGLTQCDRSCVDVAVSSLHCGKCGNPCPDVPNGVGVCAASACGIKCNAGYAECTKGQCTPLKVFYRDADGDGFGTTAQTEQKCTPSPGFVAVAGDCNDANRDVFPGQTRYFDRPYDGAEDLSYDYNCDKQETADKPYKAFTACGATCKEYGLVPQPPRKGAGVDVYCGSRLMRACGPTQIEVPVASVRPLAPPAATECSSTDTETPVLNCR